MAVKSSVLPASFSLVASRLVSSLLPRNYGRARIPSGVPARNSARGFLPRNSARFDANHSERPAKAKTSPPRCETRLSVFTTDRLPSSLSSRGEMPTHGFAPFFLNLDTNGTRSTGRFYPSRLRTGGRVDRRSRFYIRAFFAGENEDESRSFRASSRREMLVLQNKYGMFRKRYTRVVALRFTVIESLLVAVYFGSFRSGLIDNQNSPGIVVNSRK